MTRSASLVTALVLARPGGGVHVEDAGTWYTQAIKAFERDLGKDDYRVLQTYLADPTGTPGDTVDAVLSTGVGVFANVEKGTAERWYVPRPSPEMEIGGPAYPHLAVICKIGLMMQAEAHRKLASGQSEVAGRRLSGILQFASDLSMDRQGWSSHAASVLISQASCGIDTMVGRGQCDPAQAARLLGAVSEYPEDDPIRALESYVAEQEHFAQWARDTVMDDERRASMEQFDGTRGDAYPELAANAKALVNIPPEEWAHEEEKLARLADEVTQVASIADPAAAAARVTDLARRLEDGEFGHTASLFSGMTASPSIQDRFEQTVSVRKDLERQRGVLEQIRRGEVSPLESNAAYWYAKAIERVRELPKSAIVELRATRIPNVDALGELTWHENAGPFDEIVEFLERAGSCERCDFAVLDFERSPVLPEYIVPLLDCHRIVLVDATRAIAAGDTNRAMACVVAVLRMSKHLADDGIVLASMSAHVVFAHTAAVAARTLDAISGQSQRADAAGELLAVIQRASAVDPFGFGGAVERLRESVRSYCYALVGDEQLAKTQGTIEAHLDRAAGDRLWLYSGAIGERQGQGTTAKMAQLRSTDLEDCTLLVPLRTGGDASEVLVNLLTEADPGLLDAWPVYDALPAVRSQARKSYAQFCDAIVRWMEGVQAGESDFSP